MAKEVVKKIKLEIEAGKATPAPPVGTVLGLLVSTYKNFVQDLMMLLEIKWVMLFHVKSLYMKIDHLIL